MNPNPRGQSGQKLPGEGFLFTSLFSVCGCIKSCPYLSSPTGMVCINILIL